MSPAANTPGAELSRREEQRTPPRSPISRPALLRELHVGRHARAHHDRVRRQLQAAPGDRPWRPLAPSPVRPRSARARPRRGRCTPCASSSPWKKRRGLARRSRVSSVVLLLHDDRAALAHQRQRRSDLAGDVGAADQHHVLGVGDALADGVGVAERAQIVDLLELAAADVQAAHVGAGGDQRLAELDLVLVRERRRAGVAGRAPVTLVRVSSSMFCSDHHSSGRNSGSCAGLLAAQVALGALGAVVRAGRARAPRAAPRPSAPSSRSQRAQLALARPPPISR